MRQNTTRGFTLTELAIVLGVIEAMLGAVWAAADMVVQNRKSERAIAQIMEIESSIKDLLAMRNGFDTNVGSVSEVSYLAKANIFPADMPVFTDLSGNLGLRNPWVGGETIVWANANSNHPDTFRISYYGIGATACTKIASGVITKSGSADVDPVQVIVNGATTPGSVKDLTTTAMDGVSIAALCAVNGSSGSVEFDFKMTK